MTYSISYSEGETQLTFSFASSDSALEAIRFKFNPSGLASVNELKCLSSAFIAKCEQLQKANPAAGREFAVAITNMQTASMWAVLAATKGL